MTAAPLVPAYRCNGQPTTREAFYALACDPSRSVVVEACAGAGKTWMLVSRILRALLEGAEPHEVLAITFTRKAAGQMRERLNEWLDAFSEQRASDEVRTDELQARGMDLEQARTLAPRLGQLHAQLLQSGRPPQIYTFHRWFFQLLRAAPLELLGELQLSSDMQLVEDWADHEDEVYRRFHAAVLRDTNLQQDFNVLVQDHGRSQLRKWLDAAWQKRIELALTDDAGLLESSVPPASALGSPFDELAHPTERLAAPMVRQLLLEVAMQLGRKTTATAKKQGMALQQALSLADAAAQWPAVRLALYTAAGTVRKNIEVESLALAVAQVDDIHAACEQHAAHERHLRMVRLSRCLLRELGAYKRARGLADMADLELCAFKLLSNSALSGWVQERLDARIRHLLIDEFQDTSPLQWHALQAWLSGYAGAGGGASGQRPPSVFIVGDPKQSIYRFRRAEPKVFEAAQLFVQEAMAGVLLACDHTHRNAPGVLEVVNAVFEAAQGQNDYSGFRAHTTEQVPVDTAHAALCMLVPPQTEEGDESSRTAAQDGWRDTLTQPRIEPEQARRAVEAEQVADAIAQLVQAQGVPPQDIKVLSRTRAALLALQPALQARGLPFAAVGQYALADEMVVRDLLALLDVLVSPRNDLSLAHALRCPIFGASSEDLITLFDAASGASSADAAPATWWTALMALPSPSPALARAADLLTQWQQAVQQLPPHDLLDRIVAQGQVRERVAAAWPSSRAALALASVDALLEQALTLDGARYATTYRFVRALRRRSIQVAAPTPPHATALLTVHGAKGLESPWVFLMDTDPTPQAAETVTLLVDWPVHSLAPLACGFVYSTRRCPPSLQALLDIDNQARQREELNGLYVALTRAESHVVISATPAASKRASATPSWWSRLLPHATPWPEAQVGLTQTATSSAHTTLWRLPTLDANAGSVSLKSSPAVVERPPQGAAMHSRLSLSMGRPERDKEFPSGLEQQQDATKPIPLTVRPEPVEGQGATSKLPSAEVLSSGDNNSQLGEAIHLAMQWATHALDVRRGIGPNAVPTAPDLTACCEAAARLHGVPLDGVSAAVQRIWTSPECQPFFNTPRLRWAGNEVPVSVGGQVQRIDRLVSLEEDGIITWWVLDYKLHPAPQTVPAYCCQLLAYAQAVTALQAPQTVRCAFITGEGALVKLAVATDAV
jgi:ATP-dependent helicase/nuclease subunit A